MSWRRAPACSQLGRHATPAWARSRGRATRRHRPRAAHTAPCLLPAPRQVRASFHSHPSLAFRQHASPRPVLGAFADPRALHPRNCPSGPRSLQTLSSTSLEGARAVQGHLPPCMVTRHTHSLLTAAHLRAPRALLMPAAGTMFQRDGTLEEMDPEIASIIKNEKSRQVPFFPAAGAWCRWLMIAPCSYSRARSPSAK